MTFGILGAGSLGRSGARGLKAALRLSTLGLAFSAAMAAAQDFSFDQIVIDGNARIGRAAVLSRAGLEPGQVLSAAALNDAYQRLIESGLFETVELTPQAGKLRISVAEFPTINRINFEGNVRIKDEALAAMVGSAERRVFTPAGAERDAAAIAKAYADEGRIAARVIPRIIRRSDNRVDLVFEIFEGDNVEIERLSFVGNRVFSDRRLRRVLGTKQAGLFRALVRSDTFVEDRIEFDKQVLRDFYLSRGFVDFRTLSVNAELTEERDGYFLVFNVQEGQPFKFGAITVSSQMNGVAPEVYQDILKVKPGQVYSPSSVETDIARIERQALSEGVDFLRVEPRVTRNNESLTLDVEYVLSRGPRVFVERIDISGNTTTLDQVVRRQFDSVEGDPFNPREIRQSAERIRALGFFESAEVNTREGSAPDQVIVDVDLAEKPTGSLSFGGSFSSSDGFGVAIQFAEQNFLGRGQKLTLTVSTAEEAKRYGANFTEPAFLGRDVAFGFNLDVAESNSSYTTYDGDRALFQPSIAFPVGEKSRLKLIYTGQRNEMVSRSTPVHGTVIGSEIAAGAQSSSALGYEFSYDTRIGGLNPNAGALMKFGQDFSGLGGDSKYIKTTAKAVAETKVMSEEITLRASLEGGALSWQSGTNRAVDRFLLTPSIIRGFEPGGIGPRDQSVSNDDPIGGNYYVAARFEAEFPLGLPEEYGIGGGVFYDVANLWDLSDVTIPGGSAVVGADGSFRHVIGASILWSTPLGPLRFNFTNALKKETYDQEQNFEVTLSTQF